MVLNSVDFSGLNIADRKPVPMSIRDDSEVLILDFDHTLFLSNSTEEYLDSSAPRTLVAFVLAFLDWLQPWSFLPGRNSRFIYRDKIRVFVISLLFPWTYLLYRLKVRSFASQYVNQEILQILDSKAWSKVVVASNGFGFILKPLLAQMNYEFDSVIHSSVFFSQKDVRKCGKADKLKQLLHDNELARSTVITDNKDDVVLGRFVGDLKLLRWPNERRVKAGKKAYIPFLYTHASKRGNQNHVLNVMLMQDFAIFLLVYVLVSPLNVAAMPVLFLLLLSFWCIYEVGYFENDLHELRHESKHKNLEKLAYVKSVENSSLELSAWLWAFGFSLIAACLYQQDLSWSLDYWLPVGVSLLKWFGWLVGLRLLYRTYNYSCFSVRQFIFPLLQVARLGGPILFFTTNFLGVSLIASQMASRWLGYLIYRGGGDERSVQKRIVRHVIFVVLVIGLSITQNELSVLVSLQFGLMLLWSLFQGHGNSFIKGIKRWGISN